ncbi:DnaB-like helicase N-terminal domain-containing protein, partial [Dehalogenimonas sp. THU2]|uniref:DnaB-like helicase N-terminal domain-containing protein n=1 Tax=Dehalogenimonas sp. THU2 TaxID=3151121 RepID=UPI003218CAAF
MPFDTSMPLDKLPPHNTNAEDSVIGSVLIDSAVLKEFADILLPEDFYTDSARCAYTAMLSLRERGVGINQVTVNQELERTDNKLGPYLSHTINAVPTSLDAYHYATIVHRLSVNRRLITVGNQIQKIGYTADPDLDASLAAADQLVVQLRRQGGSQEIIGPQERAEQLYDRYEKLSRGEMDPSIPTGFYDLDHQLGGGFFGGQLIIMGADSGLGKSTLAQSIAINQSHNGNVLFISGEMPVDTLSDKEVASLTRRDVLDIVSGRYDDELLTDIQNALGVISTRNVYY